MSTPVAKPPPQGHETQRAASDTVWLLGSRILVAVAGYVGSIIIARSLGLEDWGRFSFVFALLALTTIVTDLGVGRAVLGRLLGSDIREVSEVATSFVALRVLLGLAGYAIAIGYVVLTGQSQPVIVATIVAGLVVTLAAPNQALTVLFQSRLKMRSVAIGDVVAQLAQLFSIALIAILGGHLVWFVVPAVLNEVVTFVWRMRKLKDGTLEFGLVRHIGVWRWGAMLRESIPLTFGFALTLLLSKIDLLMLERLGTEVAVGQYAVAYKFADVLSVATVAALWPVTTLLVAAWPDKREQLARLFRQSTVAFAAIGGMGAVAFVPVAGPAITTMYGQDFAPATIPAQILFLAAAATMITQLIVQTLIAIDRKILFPIIAAGGLLVNFLGNLYAIPRWSLLGASVVTVATEALMLLMYWFAIHRSLRWNALMGAVRPLAVLAVVGMVSVVGDMVAGWTPPLMWPLISLVCVIVFIVLLVGTRLLDEDTLDMIDPRPRGRHAK